LKVSAHAPGGDRGKKVLDVEVNYHLLGDVASRVRHEGLSSPKAGDTRMDFKSRKKAAEHPPLKFLEFVRRRCNSTNARGPLRKIELSIARLNSFQIFYGQAQTARDFVDSVASASEETQIKQPVPKSRNCMHDEKRKRGSLPRSLLSCTAAEGGAESGALRRSNSQETSSVLGRRSIDLCIAPPRQ